MRTKLRALLFLASVALITCNARVLAHTDVTPEQARDLIDSTEDLVVVDVREPSEYCDARGHIPGALNYPLTSGVLADRYEELPIDRPILVVCRSGARSNQAANFLDSMGFPEVYDMTGGMNAWLWETAPCKYAGGSGTAEDPYQIATAEQMNAIGADPNDWDKHFLLTNDIDLAAYTGTQFNIIGYVGGELARADRRSHQVFTGSFDGDGYAISNFTWNASDEEYIGLFGCIADPNAEIRNLSLIDPSVSGRTTVGALVGYLERGTIMSCRATGGMVFGNEDAGGLVGCAYGTIGDCHVKGSIVSGEWSIGGLLGHSGGSVTNCYTECQVIGNSSVGGLVGDNGGPLVSCHATGSVTGETAVGGLAGQNRGTLTNCYSSATVAGNDHGAGGLLGCNEEGTVTNCYAIGPVTGNEIAGGLVGSNGWFGIVTNCYSTGSVTGNSEVGGLAGGDWYGTITNCYSTGSVTGNRDVGGLMGGNWHSTVTNCYATGRVTGDEDTEGLAGDTDDPGRLPRVPRERHTGGLVGDSYDADVVGCFWDIDTSGQWESDGGAGKTTTDLYRATTFLGWGGGAWTINDGIDYPRLSWEGQSGQVIQAVDYPSGSGTTDDPFVIHTAEEMGLVGWVGSNWDKYFKLMADIDLSAFTGASFCIIGDDWDNAFTGVFDGNGHTISNFTYRSREMKYVGIFGYVDGPNAEIKNLGMIDPNVEAGKYGYVGSIAGRLAKATIRNCCVKGGVASGSDYDMPRVEYGDANFDSVGGLLGWNSSGYVVNCYATATVYAGGHYFGGGLVGSSFHGTITHGYSVGVVQGEDNRAGGLLAGNIRGEVNLSFWDTETSGQAESDGGMGLTTAEMLRASTFLEAGWDFVGEAENGVEDIWWIDEGRDYPRLWWEHAEAEF